MRNESIQAPILGSLSTLAILINSSVCLLVYAKKELRTHTNGFVVSLAISDLFTGITQFCIYLLRQEGRLFFNVTYALSFFGGVTTLCAVTWDRYVAVMNPLKYEHVVSRYFKAVLATSWSFTFAIALIPLTWVLNEETIRLDVLGHKIYHFVSIGLGCVVPYCATILGHFQIYHQAKKCLRQDMLRETLCHKQKSLLRKVFIEAKIARVFVLVTLMFFVSWFPLVFYTLAFASGKPGIVPEIWIYDVTPAFIALRSIANPFIYSLLKPDFVNALKKLLKLPMNHQMVLPCFQQHSMQTRN